MNSMNQWSALALGLVLRVSLLLRFFSSLKGIRFHTKNAIVSEKGSIFDGSMRIYCYRQKQVCEDGH